MTTIPQGDRLAVVSTATLSVADVRWAIEQATRAPSIHNTQPWRFRWDGSTVRLYADTERGLGALDPEGRELILSCGAALFNLRLALRKLDCTSEVRLLPDAHDPRALADVVVRRARPASAAERLAFAAMTRRHTHRGPFDDRAISADLAVALQRAADEEGATLLYVSDPGQRLRLLRLSRKATELLAQDERVRSEIGDWTPTAGSSRRDGIPPTHYAAGAAAPGPDDVPQRDFDLGRGIGTLPTAKQPPGAVAVLATAGDLSRDWLCGGQALERILVTAAEEDVAGAIHSQLTEVPQLRAELRRELVTALHPQLLLRFGYADPMPPTPRRPVQEVLTMEPPR